MRKTKLLRGMLDCEEIIVAPGASSALLAKIVEDQGFKVVYATGAGIANMQFGFPDIGITTMTEILETVNRINSATSLPVIADIDNGYGNAVNVFRTVKEFSSIGIAGLQIEDQMFPKKCGHFQGKTLISQDEMICKIKAAKDALQDPDIVIIARTDAIAINGFEDAIQRAKAYAETGADMIFIEAPENIEQMERIPKLINKPTVINMVEGGITPILHNDKLKDMGYKLVVYANGPLKAAVKGTQRLLEHLNAHGTTLNCNEMMISMKERNILTNLEDACEIEKKYSN